MKKAVIDVGSNSVRLLLDGRKTTINTQLAEKAGVGGKLLPEAMSRTAEAIRFLKEQAEKAGAKTFVFATEAVRSASNKEEFLSQVRAFGAEIDVCVPTGNFGNILAAYYARRMGTPIRRLLCASNENRVLTDFINTGTYDISERPFVKTPSPSMDILVSSNLERQLFELTGRDASVIKGWMADLRDKRGFRVDHDTFAKMRELYAADSVDNEECLRTIREVFNAQGYLMDPHTAVAFKVAENLREDGVPVVVASTAHWAKFGNNVYRALHGLSLADGLPGDVAALTGCELNKLIADETGVTGIPAGLAELDELPIRFTEVIDGNADAIRSAVCVFLDEQAR